MSSLINLWVNRETGHVCLEENRKSHYEALINCVQTMEVVSEAGLPIHVAPDGQHCDTRSKGDTVRIIATTYDSKWALLPSLLFAPMEHLKLQRRSSLWSFLWPSRNQK